MSVDYVYWTFSSAAQSISAFVAFLLTGYALVHALMDAAKRGDDSLEEVHAELIRSHYRILTFLAWLTGIAIIFSLAIVYWNRSGEGVSGWFQVLVAIIDVTAIAGGLSFVVSIVHPDRYKKAAEKVLENDEHSTSTSPSNNFFEAFLHLERLVRNYLKERDLYIPSKGAPRMTYSFRQMLDALYSNEKIGHVLYKELLDINRYRNLVFHGHVAKVDSNMIERVNKASVEITALN